MRRWPIRAGAAALLLSIYLGGGLGLAAVEAYYHGLPGANDALSRTHVESADGQGCHAERCTIAAGGTGTPIVSEAIVTTGWSYPDAPLASFHPSGILDNRHTIGSPLPRSPPL